MNVLANPEVVRNIRAHLRWDRMLAVTAICAVLSVVVGLTMANLPRGPGGWGIVFLHTVLYAQTLVLLLAGGLSAAHAIQHERERNTFDFQRATRLTPLELTVGKLFGAPILAYYIALCLMPAALVGAAVGGASPSFVLAAYVVVVLGAITFHASMLVLSLVVQRDAIATIAVLVIVVFGWLPATLVTRGVSALLSLGSLTPFFAGVLVGQTSWAVNRAGAFFVSPFGSPFAAPPTTDVLFGWPVHHFFVLVVLYVTFTAWYLLVVSRNIKRDPAAYELLTPREALGFMLYVNVILVGFLRWSSTDPLTAIDVLVGVNVCLFFACGLALLRSRDYVRRMSARGGAGLLPGWPGSYLGAGLLAIGLAVIAVLSARDAWTVSSDAGVAIFRVAICAAWVARDLAYLQWVCLLRRSRSVLTGLLSLAVFYLCAGAVLSARPPGQWYGSPLSGALAPGAALFADPSTWRDALGSWLLVLALQLVLIAALARLQAAALKRFAPPPDAASTVPA